MKSRQLWIVAATALVSFLLGVAVAPAWKNSVSEAAPQQQSGKSHDRRNFSSRPLDGSEEPINRILTVRREDKKKTGDRSISIPLSTIAETIKKHMILAHSNFRNLADGMDDPLSRLGVSPEEKQAIAALIKQTESEIYAEEKKQGKMVQINNSTMRLDISSMAPFMEVASQRIQDGIRSRLPANLADTLISSCNWKMFYPTDEGNYPTFEIVREKSGKMQGRVTYTSGSTEYGIDPKFADDGTPIPAEEAFNDDRWKPFLKGLTLLPQDEK